MIQYPAMPQQACPAQPLPEYNAIKINIQGAQVGAPAQYTYPVQYPTVDQGTTQTPPPVNAGENIDVNA